MSDDQKKTVYPTEQACRDGFGAEWGCEVISLTEGEIAAMMAGSYVCRSDGEYAHYICIAGRPVDWRPV